MASYSKQNILWIAMTIAWWLGGTIAWLGVVNQSDFMEPGLTFPQQSMRSSLLMGTGLFIVAISAVLRLPAVTEPLGASTSERMLVWLVGTGATVNWLGVLFLRSESIWPPLLVLLLALAAEIWLILTAMVIRGSKTGSGPHSTSPVGIQWTDLAASEDSECPSRASRSCSNASFESGSEESAFPMIHSTTTDQWVEDGRRQLSGEIIMCWQEGQRSQTFVFGFVPAFEAVPQLDYEADSAEEVVRCLNCTQTGMRLEIKRTGKLDAGGSVLAWTATQDGEPDSLTGISQPDISQPDISQPDISQPDISQPDISQPAQPANHETSYLQGLP